MKRYLLLCWRWNLFSNVERLTPEPRAVSAEVRLIDNLLSRYEERGKFSRPLVSTGRGEGPDGEENRVTVKYGLRLMHVDLNEKDQVMKTSAWMRIVRNSL